LDRATGNQMRSANFTVIGLPAPQGSKRHVGKGVMIEMSKNVKPWREAVKWAIRDELGPDFETIVGPVEVRIDFQLRKPKSSPKKRLHPDQVAGHRQADPLDTRCHHAKFRDRR
jgi:Holliday junction resolvase RusA-like endonuclease